ncbi:WecB/TagA/CpsF family glycosyltransferase [Lacticaseibacillus brantae]|nr:WecB/TagA/CpsF family glycosyltransferase [Lacticaseibacillus brantae]
MSRVNVLGVDFDAYTQSEFIQIFMNRLSQHQGSFVVTANPEIVMYAKEHRDYAQILAEADFVTADGIGVVTGAQMLNTPLPERVTGFDTMTALLAQANQAHLTVALIGAKQTVNDQAVANVTKQYPNLTVVYAHDGYFGLDDQAVSDAVIAAQPDMIFAALGFPKQEQFLLALKPHLPQAFMMGVGGSFDVLAGAVKRAPKWVQRVHMEWAYRLVKNPSRLPRMLVLPRFLAAVRQEAKAQS